MINKNNKQKANPLKSLIIGKASPNAASYVFSEIDKMDKELAELDFLHQLKKGNIDDPDYRKLLVNVLVNSVYLYEDDNKATIIFNASNQPSVKVDVSLLDEIKEKSGSYASPSSPPI